MGSIKRCFSVLKLVVTKLPFDWDSLTRPSGGMRAWCGPVQELGRAEASQGAQKKPKDPSVSVCTLSTAALAVLPVGMESLQEQISHGVNTVTTPCQMPSPCSEHWGFTTKVVS